MALHDTVKDVYRKAAERPESGLCCVPLAQRYLPGLNVPSIMHDMNYGCGATIHPQDMTANQTVLYVGVGGGLEALELAYFTRRPGGVIAVDPVPEMRDAARRNLDDAARTNDWFDPSFVDIRDGDAMDLPVDDASVNLAAQNCLFNIFLTAEETDDAEGELERALAEIHRVLAPGGRFSISDPITPEPIPERLRRDEHLRACCLSGCLTYESWVEKLVGAGFGSAEIRSRRPYRMLSRSEHDLERDILLETIEAVAYKVPIPDDGACIFTGRTALYTGDGSFDDGKGHVIAAQLPLPVCDKTAAALESLGRPDLVVTPSTWHYGGGGCC